jgi:hypothetical protein
MTDSQPKENERRARAAKMRVLTLGFTSLQGDSTDGATRRG